jgi:hypothetical protein
MIQKWIDETWRQQSMIDSAVEMAVEVRDDYWQEKFEMALSEKDAEIERLSRRN